jgi:hypothetical protein
MNEHHEGSDGRFPHGLYYSMVARDGMGYLSKPTTEMVRVVALSVLHFSDWVVSIIHRWKLRWAELVHLAPFLALQYSIYRRALSPFRFILRATRGFKLSKSHHTHTTGIRDEDAQRCQSAFS